MTARESALQSWLVNEIGQQNFSVSLLAGDASFRRYYRVVLPDTSFVLMDAPPALEPLTKFITLSCLLNKHKIPVPGMHAIDQQNGFILMEDLGDGLFLDCLTAQNAGVYYQQALTYIQQMQAIPVHSVDIPTFQQNHFATELQLFIDWFCLKYLNLNLSDVQISRLNQELSGIAKALAGQPTCFVHRDYHSRNIMITGEQPLAMTIIDFQDAIIGPYTYDAVSLLKDCYIDWPDDQQQQWCQFYFDNSSFQTQKSFEQFMHDFHICGLQRHLRVLGTFSRLYLRDGKPRYLDDMPRIIRYIEAGFQRIGHYPLLQRFFADQVRLP